MLDKIRSDGGSGFESNNENNQERETVKGILVEKEKCSDILEYFENSEVDNFILRVDPEKLSELRHLNCFGGQSNSINKHTFKKSADFAIRNSDKVDVYLKIRDSSDLEVNLSMVDVTDIDNKIIADFVKTFRTEICTTFDPMAENHKEPHISISPF